MNFQDNIFSPEIISSVGKKSIKSWDEDIIHPSFPQVTVIQYLFLMLLHSSI